MSNIRKLTPIIEEIDSLPDIGVTSRLALAVGSEGYDASQSWLVKGLIPGDSSIGLYGPSGSFKSFLALSLCCHISIGKEWDGRKVTQGNVLYVVGEGGIGVPRRIRGWEKHFNNGEPLTGMYRVKGPVFPATREAVFDVINDCQYIENQTGQPVKLVVFDTLARCFGGNDENSAKDMGAFIQGCDAIKQGTGATVMVVHHSGKNEEAGARGSSALRGALDVELMVKRDGKETALTLSCMKMKDAEAPDTFAYDLKSLTTHFDEDGDPVTTLVLIPEGREATTSENKPNAGNVSGNHQAVWQAVRSRRKVGESVSQQVVRGDLKAQGIDTKNLARWIAKLVDDGQLIKEGDLLFMPDSCL
ncbi:MAG: AAA family ATPase [Oceanospirillaceae bacterium]|nr:AAA family ATPase [Oceanospirillaceae bacterium]